MSNLQLDSPGNDFVYVLFVLAAIAGSLFAIFSFLATAQVGETLALVLFLVVGGLLIAAYMVGLMVLGLAIVPLAKSVSRLRDQRSIKEST